MTPLKYFFGMEFARSKKGIFISERKYILDLLNETGLLGCKATETPIKPNLKLQPASLVEVIDKEKYQCLVGRLIHLSHTRPDIAFAVSMVSQFMHSPNQGHFDVVYRILRYLKGTPRKGLLYENWGHLQGDQHQAIVLLLEAILWLDGIKSKMLWLKVVLKLSLEQ